MSQALTVEKRHGAAPFAGSGALAVAPKKLGGRTTGPLPTVPQKPRTPLSVVPVRPVHRRMPFAVFSLLVLGAALAAVLMLNISVSGTQYDLVQLRNQQVALSQQNEALVLEIEAKEAPQNLAAAATKLGMVSSPSFGTIELGTKKVTGTPEPAVKGPKPEALIAAPKLGTEESAATAVKATAGDDAEPTGLPADRSGGGSAGNAEDQAQDGAASAAAGTIPGPQQLDTDR